MSPHRKSFVSAGDRTSRDHSAEDAYSASSLKILNSYVTYSDQKHVLTSKYVPNALKVALIEAINQSSYIDIKHLSVLCRDIEMFASEQLLWQGMAAHMVENVLIPSNTSRMLHDIGIKLCHQLTQITEKDISMFIAKSQYNRSQAAVAHTNSSFLTKIFEFANGNEQPRCTNSICTHSLENVTRYTLLAFFDYFMINVESFVRQSFLPESDTTNNHDYQKHLVDEFLRKRSQQGNWQEKLKTLNEQCDIFNDSASLSSSTSSLNTVITINARDTDASQNQHVDDRLTHHGSTADVVSPASQEESRELEETRECDSTTDGSPSNATISYFANALNITQDVYSEDDGYDVCAETTLQHTFDDTLNSNIGHSNSDIGCNTNVEDTPYTFALHDYPTWATGEWQESERETNAIIQNIEQIEENQVADTSSVFHEDDDDIVVSIKTLYNENADNSTT